MAIAYLDDYPNKELILNLPTVKKKCFCNRDFTEKELRNIVIQLRKRETSNITPNGRKNWYIKQNVFTLNKKNPENRPINIKYLNEAISTQKNRWIWVTQNNILALNFGNEYYNLETAEKIEDSELEHPPTRYAIEENKFTEMGDKLFNSNRNEKITGNVNYSIFTSYLNATFNTHNINTCIRKIHFLAQCYHETGSFVHTYEGDNAVTTPIGGKDFIGRGIKQITHDENYLAYYDYWNATNNMSTTSYLDKCKTKTVTKVIETINTKPTLFPKDFLNTLKDFAKTLATDLQRACDSAGWFWSYKKGVYKAADADDVDLLTNKINGGSKGIDKRREYTQNLKEILDYDNCKNKQ